MKRLILIFSLIPTGIAFGLIPYAASDTLLKLYPWPQNGVEITAPACTINVLQNTIWIAIGNEDSITWAAARVCAGEIKKNFYYAIDSINGPIKTIRIEQRNSLPNDTVVIAIGKKGDPLINSISGINDLIPSKTEGYVLKEVVQNKKLLIVGAGYDLKGTFHAVSTLRELIAQNSRGVVPSTMLIQDWPDIFWREVGWAGSELGSPYDTTLKQLQKLDYLSLLKCNLVQHENHGYYFKAQQSYGNNPFLYQYPNDYLEDIDGYDLKDVWYC